MRFVGALMLLLCASCGARAQENAGTSVAPSLFECYNTTALATRDYRLPATMGVLVELLRKIEDDGASAANNRELAIQVLQRFRQDGIWKNERDPAVTHGLPYSPRGWEAYKGRVQLRQLTPGSAATFNNNSLSAVERCSLHFSISSTIEAHERGDEAFVCSRTARYHLRLRRDAELAEGVRPLGAPAGPRSACPVEGGVVYTKWGAVKAGLVLGGIAAGLQQMYVPAEGGRRSDNRFASTIAGELAEAALYQRSDSAKIGAMGGWNSTVVPRYYFLKEQDNLETTDAEIRGGLDGLYLALSAGSWRAKAPNIKISQLLDLYYSPRGVFNQSLRACNRKLLQTSMFSSAQLIDEVTSFSYILDSQATSLYSKDKSYFPELAKNAVNNFNNYISSINDLECSAEEATIERAGSDLLIFLDAAWSYATAQAVLSYVVENIDANKFGTNYAIYNGHASDVIVNNSHSLLDYYETYNMTEHQRHPIGFDYNKIFQYMENYFKAQLDNETSVVRGRSTIALLMPHEPPNDNQKQFAVQRKEIFKSYLPDLRILVVGSGAKEAYGDLVLNGNDDAFSINDGADDSAVKGAGRSITNRIRRLPRNVANPRCGSQFSSDEASRFELTQHVEPQGVNYHRVAPNYFFSGGDGRRLLVRELGYGTVTVCISRTDTNPRGNSSDHQCETLASREFSYNLDSPCDGDAAASCRPIYVSVEGLSSKVGCKDNLCRFPDSIKYQITLENVGCVSGGSERIIGSFLVIAIFAILRF